MALGTDEIARCGKTTGKTGFLCCRRVLASCAGESPVQSIAILLITRSPTAAVAAAASRGRGARLARIVNVGALMTVQVPEGLGPGSVFTVDVPGRGACRVTVPPGVFAGQTFTLLHPDYVGTSN